MTAQILNGRKLARELQTHVMDKITALKNDHGITPHLSVILVGDHPASELYVRNKKRAAKKIGIDTVIHHLPVETPQEDILKLIRDLNDDQNVHGILVQLPLPKHMDPAVIINALHPLKDVDGLHIQNAGVLASGGHALVPCTPLGVMTMIQSVVNDLKGLNAVVIGKSNLVGKPMAQMLMRAGATVGVCHSYTKNITDWTRMADILVVAAGSPALVKPDWVKPGAVVIDVGITRLPDGTITGDVDKAVASVAGFLSPVPGGVGPMTIASLLSNTVTACCLQNGVEV